MYGARGFGAVDEIVRIPVIEYLLVGVLAALVGAGLRAAGLVRRRRPAGASQDEG
ncbi:hypothetical protein [Planomonospora parontospora]|uniref:hypothetical protein n=1 Tax=Planomonospora parontospora TaxID=58119 RepID=UPI0016712454|nr:hypothetical protein [Planomonospora parontospora]